MRLVNYGFTICEDNLDYKTMLLGTERKTRKAYKSEDLITEGSAESLIERIVIAPNNIYKKHNSVLDHHRIGIDVVVNRVIGNEIERHRIAAYTQESTRYCNYAKDKFGKHVTFVIPYAYKDYLQPGEYSHIMDLLERNKLTNTPMEQIIANYCTPMFVGEYNYLELIRKGEKPQVARDVLPLSLKTEIAITYALSTWRYVLQLRTQDNVHPDLIDLMINIKTTFKKEYPVFFKDL